MIRNSLVTTVCMILALAAFGAQLANAAPASDIAASSVVSKAATSLGNGIPATGLNVASGGQQMFTFDIPMGATSALFQTTGGTGDVDVFVQLGAAPTSSSYLQRAGGPTNFESISLAYPAAGTYYIMLYGYTAASDFQLVANYSTTGGNILTPGVPLTNVGGPKASNKIWTINVPAGRSSLTIKTSGGLGNCDMYLQLNTAPSLTTYLARSNGYTNSESITLTSPAAGTYYVMLHGYTSFSGVTLLAND